MLCNGRWIFNSLVGGLVQVVVYFSKSQIMCSLVVFMGFLFFSVDGNGTYNGRLLSIVLTHFHGRITIEGRATAVTSIGSVVLV